MKFVSGKCPDVGTYDVLMDRWQDDKKNAQGIVCSGPINAHCKIFSTQMFKISVIKTC